MKTGISEQWKLVAKCWVGNKNGKHCHWCKHIDHDGELGTSNCIHPKSKFNDGNRIRSWDGEACAEECGFFELQDWYKDDDNIDKYTRIYKERKL